MDQGRHQPEQNQNLYELYNSGQTAQGAGQPPPPFQASPGSPPPPFQSLPGQPPTFQASTSGQPQMGFQSNTAGQPQAGYQSPQSQVGYQSPQPLQGFPTNTQGQPQQGFQSNAPGQPQQGFQSNAPGQPQQAYQPNFPVQQQQQQQQHQPGMTQQPGGAGAPRALQYQTAVPLQSLSMGPGPVDCPACGTRGMTTIDYAVGQHTHLWAFCLCFWCCLGCIPYLISDLQDVKHTCGNCGTLLAVWRRGGGGVQVMVHAMR